jgi:hypothetical protein
MKSVLYVCTTQKTSTSPVEVEALYYMQDNCRVMKRGPKDIRVMKHALL